MNQYLYRVEPRRPALLTEGPTPEKAAAIGAHFESLQKLTDASVVLLAGRTLNTDASAFGIVIFEAESEGAAEEIVAADPAVSAGVMRSELFPYQVVLWSERGPSG